MRSSPRRAACTVALHILMPHYDLLCGFVTFLALRPGSPEHQEGEASASGSEFSQLQITLRRGESKGDLFEANAVERGRDSSTHILG